MVLQTGRLGNKQLKALHPKKKPTILVYKIFTCCVYGFLLPRCFIGQPYEICCFTLGPFSALQVYLSHIYNPLL